MVHDGSEQEVRGALGAWPPARQGMYDPAHEHDACGLGFIAHIKGQKNHTIIRHALAILENLLAERPGDVGLPAAVIAGAGQNSAAAIR
mgnify:CR=1 FL=1